ncbi:MAG: hypothetical protein J7K47_01315 [Thermoplasmata archaeon]|nr:hypothetical protein [Thermoplasmata archaeon]
MNAPVTRRIKAVLLAWKREAINNATNIVPAGVCNGSKNPWVAIFKKSKRSMHCPIRHVLVPRKQIS